MYTAVVGITSNDEDENPFRINCAGATPAPEIAVFTGLSMAGSSVSEAYQVLLKSAVVIQMIPFIYLFLTLARTTGISAWLSTDGGSRRLPTISPANLAPRACAGLFWTSSWHKALGIGDEA